MMNQLALFWKLHCIEEISETVIHICFILALSQFVMREFRGTLDQTHAI